MLPTRHARTSASRSNRLQGRHFGPALANGLIESRESETVAHPPATNAGSASRASRRRHQAASPRLSSFCCSSSRPPGSGLVLALVQRRLVGGACFSFLPWAPGRRLSIPGNARRSAGAWLRFQLLERLVVAFSSSSTAARRRRARSLISSLPLSAAQLSWALAVFRSPASKDCLAASSAPSEA
jgi:hypothetical protein